MDSTDTILDLFRLDGKKALVTGGSKGLGKAATLALAQAGCDAVIASRKAAELQQTARSIAEATGRKIIPFCCNVRNLEEVNRLVNTCVDTLEGLDIIVNSAGINNRKLIVDLSEDEFREIIDINLTGTFRVCKAAAPFLLQQKSGRVINISSMLDQITIPGRTGYASSKGGVAMLTKTLALEWAPYNIRVNAISPGPFPTEMNKPILDDPEKNRGVTERIPIKRWGKPVEIGAACVYLASPASDFITGTTLTIDGGWTAH